MTRGVPSKVEKDGTFGFEEFAHLTDPARIDAMFKKYLPKTHDYVGTNIFQPAAVKKITRERPFAPNAALTIAIKKSSTPLVDNGDLVGSIGHEVVDGGMTLRMGVSSPKTKSGRYLYEILHNGATITVTPAVRAAVFAKLRNAVGDSAFKAMRTNLKGPGARVWHIPARPFLTDLFEDKAWLAEAIQPYKELVRLVMLEDAKTHGT